MKVRHSTMIPALAFLLAAGILVRSGPAQVPVQLLPDVQPQTPGVAIDGAFFEAPASARTVGQRLAPQISADVVALPETREPTAIHGPDVAGYIEPLPAGLVPEPIWTQTGDGGQVWAVELTSAGAHALRIRLAGRFGFDGLQLRVYDPLSGAAFGPYQGLATDENDHWWTTIVFGDSIGLEFYLPPGGAFPPAMPAFDGVGYYNLPPPPPADPQPRGCDMEDAACYADWQTTASAVCMLATINAQQNVVGFCSGALLNRSPSDACPLVMTANHCGIGSRFTVFVWNFQNASCLGDPTSMSPNSFPRNEGAWILRVNSDSDWNLLGIADQPVVVSTSFLGWASGFWDSFADGNGIHHPAGMTRSISFGYNEGALYGEFCDQNGDNCIWAHVWGVRWTTGSTRPGSSGSPVLDSSRRVRGTLTGSINCDVSYYGRFAHAYDDLQPFLSNIASPVYVDAGYSGFEAGTSDEPFNDLVAASYCVIAGDDVRLRPGTYNQQCRIFRPMRLLSTGGTARIGG